MSNHRSTQSGARTLSTATPRLRSTQSGSRSLSTMTPSVRPTQSGMRALSTMTPLVRTTGVSIRVLSDMTEVSLPSTHSRVSHSTIRVLSDVMTKRFITAF
jgi:hypothetical protein